MENYYNLLIYENSAVDRTMLDYNIMYRMPHLTPICIYAAILSLKMTCGYSFHKGLPFMYNSLNINTHLTM